MLKFAVIPLVAALVLANEPPSFAAPSREKTATAAKKVLIVLTSNDKLGNTGLKTGFYLSEVSHPYYVFRKAGYTVDFVSPKGGKPPMDGMKLNDPQNKAFIEDREAMAKLEHSLRPTDVNPADYDAIFYAGGHGTMWDFPDNEQLARIAAAIYKRGGVVSAVCHGPAGLLNVKLSNGAYLVNGKTVSSFTNDEEAAVKRTEVVPFLLESKLIERGAKFSKAPNFEPHVAVSERLVTGQNPASAGPVAEKVVEMLGKSTTTRD